MLYEEDENGALSLDPVGMFGLFLPLVPTECDEFIHRKYIHSVTCIRDRGCVPQLPTRANPPGINSRAYSGRKHARVCCDAA